LAASDGVHLAGGSINVTAAVISQTLGSPGRTARRTAPGFIGEAFGCEKLLFLSRKGERFSALGTLKGFFCISH
jgi:hypothetical protein